MVAEEIFTLQFGSEKMLGRRGKSFLPTLGVIGLLLLSIYGYYVYYQLKERCEKTDHKLSYLVKRQVSLKSQLQVVYEHRSKLEAALLKQRTTHKATKHDFATKMVECAANLTRAKQQAMNRFNALDTEHRMQKTRHEEIVTDFDRLTQQYVRLTKDHQQIVTGHKEDYQKLKEAKEQESKSLQERVETLHNESEETLAEKRKFYGFYNSERTERLRLETTNKKIHNSMDKLKTELSSLKEDKLESQTKIEKAEEQIEDLEKKIQELTRKSKNDVVASKNKPTDIVKAAKKSRANKARAASTAAPVASTIPPTQKAKDRLLDIGTADKSTPQRKALVIKPSDKVQGILIGKKDVDPEALHSKKEDSIKDQYEVSETSERGNSKMVTEEKTEPLGEGLVEQEPGDEVNFQHLVKSGIVLDGGKGNSGPTGAKGVERGEMKSERVVDTNLAGNYEEKKVKRGLKKGLMKALITTNAEKEKESLKREIPRKPSELDALKKKAVLNMKSEDEGASFLRRQQQLLHRPIARVQDVEAHKAETEIDKKISEPNESQDAVVENPEKDDETIKVSDGKETEEIKDAKELGEEEIKAKKNNEDEPTEGLEDHNDIETEPLDSKDQDPKSYEETKGVGEDEKEEAGKNSEEKNEEGINPRNSNLEKEDDVDKTKEVAANNRNEKINHVINKELKSLEKKESEEKKMLKKDEEGTKNEENRAGNQIKPPNSNVFARGDAGTANEKPAKQRQQLRPPLGRRKSNSGKHNKAEETKGNIELDDGKTGNVDKNEGKQLHAPIKPQRKRRAEEATNDAEKPPREEKETKDAKEAQSHIEDKAAGQPTSHMTLEDDENGDQDWEGQDPGIAEREDDGKPRGFDEDN